MLNLTRKVLNLLIQAQTKNPPNSSIVGNKLTDSELQVATGGGMDPDGQTNEDPII